MSTTLLTPLTARLRLQCTSRLNHPRIPSLLRPQFTSQFHTSPTLQVIRKHGKAKKFTAPAAPTTTTTTSTTSPILHSVKSAPKTTPKATATSQPLLINHTAHRLASLPTETLVYANLDRRLLWGCALISSLSLGWVIHMIRQNILFPPTDGLPKWALGMTYVGGVAMSFVAGLALWYPGRIVRSIKAVPRSLQTAAMRSKAGEGGLNGGLVLRVERLMFPLPFKRTYDLLPEELVLSRPIGNGVEVVQREYRTGLVGAVMDGPKKAFHLLRDLMDTNQIVPMVAKGRKQPFIMTQSGWQWEERGVDRLVKSVNKIRYA
ncbi:hypothetical protein BJ508DRAFT_415219, partial [Ascobolus immersus RN42]